jgi:PAS domain S-box-containing protein
MTDFARDVSERSARVAELVASAQAAPLDRVLVLDVLTELESLFEAGSRAAQAELAAQSDEALVAEAALAGARLRYDELFESGPDGSLVTDEHGRIVEANAAAGAMFDVAPDALIGSLLMAHVEAGQREGLRGETDRMRSGPGPSETLLTLPSGLIFRVAVVSSADAVGDKQTRWSFRDVSRRIELEREVGRLQSEVELWSGLNRLLRLTGDGDAMTSALDRIAKLAEAAVPGAHVGASVARGRTLVVASAPSPVAAELDDMQHRDGIGPCLEARETGGRVDVEVDDGCNRWPALAARASELGVCRFIALPLVLDGDSRGALNLYATEAVDDHHYRLLDLLASEASTAIANADLFGSAAKLAQELTTALANRGPIEQAKGILMAREGIDADAAFDVLRRASQRTNRKLREIALEIVEHVATGAG